jgi:hypothetical protein
MCIFTLPSSLIDEIEKMLNAFRWGTLELITKVFIGFFGIKMMEAWASKISQSSIWQCRVNKVGAYGLVLILLLLDYTKQDIFQSVAFLTL